MSGVVEAYYTPAQLATLLNFTTQWVVKMILAGEFGPNCVRIGSKRADYRVPASGVNAWLTRNRVIVDLDQVKPITARSPGELRRKSKRFNEPS